MCSRSRRPGSRTLAAALLAAALLPGTRTLAGEGGDSAELRVCADPNNLPFSDRSRSGFENALAELVAGALERSVTYTWYPQRRGFVRNTLGAHLCDVIMGVPAEYELARTTKPYYVSSYVFVTRTRDGHAIRSFDDPSLERLRIGVPVVGDDYSSTPGAVALGRRGLISNMVGYSVYGNYSEPHPPSRIIDAVASGDIDVAVVWGPLAGYFAQRATKPLSVTKVEAPDDGNDTPFVFAISMAVRPDDDTLLADLNATIEARGAEIHALLARFGVPLVDTPPSERRASQGGRRSTP